jgi:hypothetical protein
MEMANTYTQMYVHILFAVSKKECLIKAEWKEEMQRYMAGIIRNKGHRLAAIKGNAGSCTSFDQFSYHTKYIGPGKRYQGEHQ